MTFRPTREHLAPELSQREQIVVLARALWREGYNDHLAGHITVNQGDGTLLCNPWLLTWEEFGPDDVIRIDLDGKVLEGDWPAPLGIPLHLELHKARPGIQWALHHHPQWGTVWADLVRVPPLHDQTGAGGGGGELVMVDEYDGGVDDANAAASAVAKMGDAELALLAHHGVFVLAKSVAAAYWRAASLEWRCQKAWQVEMAGGGPGLPEEGGARFRASDGTGFVGYWETAVRRELRADAELAERLGVLTP
jgi:L-ribulose-5-phosphate 4-epimerase